MEREFFTHSGWDQASDWALQFYNVKFIKDFGPFKVGDMRHCIVIDFEKGVMESYNGAENDEVYESVKIGLCVKGDD